MPPVPQEFAVVPAHQTIPGETLASIEDFIRVFERVTTRPAWQRAVTAAAPEIARLPRAERCFFGAWDLHLPPAEPDRWQLIEFNDNGSGFLFAGLINRLFYDLSHLDRDPEIEPPPRFAVLCEQILAMVEREAGKFFGGTPEGLFLVLDDPDSLAGGRFRQELMLLRDLFRRRGWAAETASPRELQWDGQRLRLGAREVCFIVNRSTDFLWAGEELSPVSCAYREGRVYLAPNPFSYSTRSDKRLLEPLSRADWDEELGIRPDERAVLSSHVPETHLLTEDNLEHLAREKDDFVFKPSHGFAGRGLLPSSHVGRSRLRRLLGRGEGYVAQRRVAKSTLGSQEGPEQRRLWTDLRVWAYRGQSFLLSGRASLHPDRLDLGAPGGWLPTYARAAAAAGRRNRTRL